MNCDEVTSPYPVHLTINILAISIDGLSRIAFYLNHIHVDVSNLNQCTYSV